MTTCMNARSGGIQVLVNQGFFPKDLGAAYAATRPELEQDGFVVLSDDPTLEVVNPDINVALILEGTSQAELGHLLVVRSDGFASRFSAHPVTYGGYEPRQGETVEYWQRNTAERLPPYFQLVDYAGPVQVPDRLDAQGNLAPGWLGTPALKQGSLQGTALPAYLDPDPGGRVFEIYTGGPGVETLVGWLHLPSADGPGPNADDHLETQRWYGNPQDVVYDAATAAFLLPASTGVWHFQEVGSTGPVPWDAQSLYAPVAPV